MHVFSNFRDDSGHTSCVDDPVNKDLSQIKKSTLELSEPPRTQYLNQENSAITHNPMSLSVHKTTPKTRKIKALSMALYRLKRRKLFSKQGTKSNINLGNVQIYLKNILRPNLYQLVDSQIRNCQNQRNGRRWTFKDKSFALIFITAVP